MDLRSRTAVGSKRHESCLRSQIEKCRSAGIDAPHVWLRNPRPPRHMISKSPTMPYYNHYLTTLGKLSGQINTTVKLLITPHGSTAPQSIIKHHKQLDGASHACAAGSSNGAPFCTRWPRSLISARCQKTFVRFTHRLSRSPGTPYESCELPKFRSNAHGFKNLPLLLEPLVNLA